MANAHTQRIFLFPDLHCPYHSEEAFSCALDVISRWRPHTVVCLGDFGDLARISKFLTDPRKTMSTADEIKAIRLAMARLTKAAGKAKKVFLVGNHDLRIDLYLLRQAPEFREFVDIGDLYNLDKHGWGIVPYKQSFRMGELLLSHDFGRAGVNAARQSVIDVGNNVAFGHTHRLQVHYQGTADGKRHVGATLGWLGDPEAIDYRHRDLVRRDYQHGFGAVHMLKDGRFWLQAVPIVKGQAVVDGVVYG